jgi:hypothetical protein
MSILRTKALPKLLLQEHAAAEAALVANHVPPQLLQARAVTASSVVCFCVLCVCVL